MIIEIDLLSLVLGRNNFIIILSLKSKINYYIQRPILCEVWNNNKKNMYIFRFDQNIKISCCSNCILFFLNLYKNFIQKAYLIFK